MLIRDILTFEVSTLIQLLYICELWLEIYFNWKQLANLNVYIHYILSFLKFHILVP